jgi:FxsC-like protein
MTGGRGSRVADEAISLLSKSNQPQIDALRLRLDLPTGGLPSDAPPASRVAELWEDARKAGGTTLAILDDLVREQQRKPAPVYGLYVTRAFGENDQSLYQTFFDRLASKLQQAGVFPQGDLRHLDAINPREPDVWSPWSLRAMERCSILICLYSKDYFSNPHCGKIWAGFLQRLKSQLGYDVDSGNSTPLILPILWDPPEENPPILPRVARNIQDRSQAFDAEYRQKGLLFIQKQARAKRDDYEAKYEQILDILAAQIGAAIQQDQLTEEEVPSLADLPDVFRQGPSQLNAGVPYARFVFFAATRKQISGLRDPASYGDEPKQWRPYYPQSSEAIEWTTFDSAHTAGRTADVVRFDDNFLATLHSADRNGEPIIVLADPWTTHSRIYQRYEEDYDSAELPGSRFLICRNADDAETKTNWNILRHTLVKTAFRRKYEAGRVREIVSFDQFREELANAILSAHKHILDAVEDPRVASGLTFVRPGNIGQHQPLNGEISEPVRTATSDRITSIAQPRVQAPVGGPGG